MTLRERYNAVIAYFQQAMPVAETELHYDDPFQLLVAVVLSAQCTDRRVNLTTPALFAAFPTVQAMAQASADEIFPYIKSISYPNNKARHLAALSRQLVEQFDGQVPDMVEQLMTLQGVGRKTANVVASVVYNQPRMAVDTHVFRVAERIGLTTHSRTPLQTELTLVKYIPEQEIPRAHHWLILHGRYVCTARQPHCDQCGIQSYCRYAAAKAKKAEKE